LTRSATLIAFDLFGLAPDSAAGLAVHFFVMDVAKILVLLTAVIYIMGWLRALLTPERVRAMMKGRSGPGARLTAVGLGAVTPFCSCSSIPLFIGFVEAGIPLRRDPVVPDRQPDGQSGRRRRAGRRHRLADDVDLRADRPDHRLRRRLRAAGVQAGTLGGRVCLEDPDGRSSGDGT
jgi:hypothetical protein